MSELAIDALDLAGDDIPAEAVRRLDPSPLAHPARVFEIAEDRIDAPADRLRVGVDDESIFIVRGDDPNPTVAALRQYKGKVLQTTLPEEAEDTLRRGLEGRSWD